jgi:hypothetical protein
MKMSKAKKLSEIVYYLIHDQKMDGVSLPKLMKMLYLAEWKQVIDNGTLLTGEAWSGVENGPYCQALVDLALGEEDEYINYKVSSTDGMSSTTIVYTDQKRATLSLSSSETSILDFVKSTVTNMGFNDLVKIVYSTYPMIVTSLSSSISNAPILDLLKLAKDYKLLRSKRKKENE